MPLEQLSEKGMKPLREQRDAAIDTLARRMLLPPIDAAVLKARPIGRLHIDDSAGEGRENSGDGAAGGTGI